jgi:hypothetical protein
VRRTNPFAHVLIMGAASIAAFVLLHHIRTDLSGHRPGGGVLARATGVAVGMGITATVGAAGSATVKGAKGLARLGRGTDPPPWERLDAAASGMHGQPQPGFNPIPDGGDGGGTGGGGVPVGGGGGPGSPGAPTGGATTVVSDLPGPSQPGRAAGKSTRARRRAGAQSDTGGEPGGLAGSSGGVAPSVPPMTEWVESAYDSDVLIPHESPDDETAPPSQEGGPAPPAPTTVDPIAEKHEAD